MASGGYGRLRIFAAAAKRSPDCGRAGELAKIQSRGQPAPDDRRASGAKPPRSRGVWMFLRILDRLEEVLIASLMAAATLIIFAAVIQRYGSGIPLLYPYFYRVNMSWAQELCVYMFVWMAKFGAAYGVRTGIHVGVDVLVNILRPALRNKVILFSLFCGALFTFVVGTMGAKFIIELFPTDQVSPDMEMPRWLVFACVPLGSYLMCFRFLQVAWHFWRTGELPHHDPGHVEGVAESPAAATEMSR